MSFSGCFRRLIWCASVAVAFARPAFAGNYPLEIINIKPGGTSHRIYRAYPGIQYNIRAAVIGGTFPYEFSLSNAPAGMTIDARGEILWLNPLADASPTIHVRDAEGTQTSASWGIDVTTTGFRFVSAVGGDDTAAGTLAAPWKTFAGIYRRGKAGEIVYWRGGTYSPDGVPVQAADHPLGEEFILWQALERPATWLAYPGERPIFDFGYVGNGAPYDRGDSVPRLKITGPNLYVDGLTFTRSMTMAFQVNHGGMAGTTFRRNTFDTTGPGIDGGNSAFIMFVAAQGANSLHTVVQDNVFRNVRGGSANSGLKLYTLTKPLFEDNLFHDFDQTSEGLAIKAAIVQYTVRGNRFYNVSHGIGGNMDLFSPADRTRGEILYNTVKVSGTPSEALHFNQNGEAGETFIYRNTFIGKVLALNVDDGDGPFRLYNNVIVNDDSGSPRGSRVTWQNVGAPGQVVVEDNLTGSSRDNLVNADGLLTKTHAKYQSTHGSGRPLGAGGSAR